MCLREFSTAKGAVPFNKHNLGVTFLVQGVACNMAQATYTAFETASRKALATESGGKSAQTFDNWDNSGVLLPSPRLDRP